MHLVWQLVFWIELFVWDIPPWTSFPQQAPLVHLKTWGLALETEVNSWCNSAFLQPSSASSLQPTSPECGQKQPDPRNSSGQKCTQRRTSFPTCFLPSFPERNPVVGLCKSLPPQRRCSLLEHDGSSPYAKKPSTKKLLYVSLKNLRVKVGRRAEPQPWLECMGMRVPSAHEMIL